DFVYVDRAIDRATDVGITERAAAVVQRDIQGPERGFPLEPLRVLLLPPGGLPKRDLGHGYPAGEKFSGARERLRDDANGQRLAGGRPSPVIGILCKIGRAHV